MHITVVHTSAGSTTQDGIRTSLNLTSKEVENLRLAAEYALKAGYPLYHHLIIRWISGDWFLGRDEHEYIQRKLSEWLSNNIGFAYFIWVKEANTRPHSHFLIHLPDKHWAKKLREMVGKWMKAYHGLKKRDGLPKKTLRLRGLNTGWYFDTATAHQNQVNYVTKRARDMPGVKLDEGIVVGIPCHCSQSLGPEARSSGVIPRYKWDAENLNISAIKFPAPKPQKSPISGNTHAQGMVQLQDRYSVSPKNISPSMAGKFSILKKVAP